MSVYTVYEPPLRAVDALADAQRFVFVRDGFYFWAFLLTPFWMLRHRLWLVLVLYLVVSVGIETTLRILGAPASVIAIVGILISFLAGLEAGTLRRFTLTRRGWLNIGTVSGAKAEGAELRFFDTWLQQAPARSGSAPPAKPSVPPSPSPPRPEAPGVIGLFPEPGAQR
jgi:hypothetical protein